MSKVLIIAPIYKYYPILIHALQLQTHEDWELLMIHDGPDDTGIGDLLQRLSDSRVRFHETDVRYNDWGHSLRSLALECVAQDANMAEFIVITNADNYYAPGFLSVMLQTFDADTVAVCCGIAHSYFGWTAMIPKLRFTQIDGGCVVARREAALAVGWRSREHYADWVYISDILRKYGANRIKLIPNILFVHN